MPVSHLAHPLCLLIGVGQ